MKKRKHFHKVRFSPEDIAEIGAAFRARLDKGSAENASLIMNVSLQSEGWEHSDEAEFLSDVRKDPAEYSYRILAPPHDLIIGYDRREARAVVCLGSRADIESVFHVIERLAPAAQLPSESCEQEDDCSQGPTIFIGHGRSPLWRDLKDHLQDHHDFLVEAYEVGARAGHAIRDVLEDMLESSSMAFLVMTAEDEVVDGMMRARQNVVHEIGLFQGRLGFSRGIVLMEEGVEEFSNISGVHQIRFHRGAIRETFGDVLATIYREFPDVA